MDKKIAFIGAGSMAEAIISGMVRAEIVDNNHISVTNRSNQERISRLEKRYQINSVMDKEKITTDTDIIILATKPYDIEQAIDSIKDYITANQLIISVTAGISTTAIKQFIGINVPVIRAMPNTSASIGESATAISAGKGVSKDHVQEAVTLFNTIGTTVVVDEEDMHMVTAISGSGPAYIYYLVEAMEKAAVDSGLHKDTAKALIAQTILGAGEMLSQSEDTADVLRKKITSPAGTTQAGLESLKKNGFQQIIIECVQAARDRSIALGKE
ncbi:MAG: pyrroline-5-carboxylate reductase [Bacillota bacterium]|uniref:Pyrroline-5-carboxylate reductase n=1 Tax=Virgibacillus salarius TaxID=447199 RepID=A0A941DY42_9BACI|nr:MULTISPECIES: pyrroline-5-carboxylate reductase [Bacillaceae]NAZ09943.1 pyrroline-5-carboxylate reductase [Agaribacter marinus]MBR7797234.1 pyrroline-5-carboxylate reductase [Virgibacillus salarius]MCC2250152.1 pyrroline-5-carboxylate reductase [Virgibacillus sp. AGTR]MDY7045712.1 pyrroline-5-carboxylate reductase [Virgibacillus sp. M23]QRZ19035.1 pyrroline-5-carboxylate reductase [Virgibacillus sp. AGTR]